MGEVTDMVLDGTLCKTCGVLVYNGNGHLANKLEITPGFPRNCRSCEEEEIRNKKQEKERGKAFKEAFGGGAYCIDD
jgi:hypothetical protein